MSMRALLLSAVLLSACGSPRLDTSSEAEEARAAKTTVSPEPGPFNDRVTVTLTSDPVATLYYTTDGADPAAEGPSRKVGKSKVSFDLTATANIKYFSRTDRGVEESASSATFIRAGGAPGTITGVVVVDTVAVGKALAVSLNGGTQTRLNAVGEPGEAPFTFTGLSEGGYRLRALAVRERSA